MPETARQILKNWQNWRNWRILSILAFGSNVIPRGNPDASFESYTKDVAYAWKTSCTSAAILPRRIIAAMLDSDIHIPFTSFGASVNTRYASVNTSYFSASIRECVHVPINSLCPRAEHAHVPIPMRPHTVGTVDIPPPALACGMLVPGARMW